MMMRVISIQEVILPSYSFPKMSILDLCILFKDAGIALLHDDGKISLE